MNEWLRRIWESVPFTRQWKESYQTGIEATAWILARKDASEKEIADQRALLCLRAAQRRPSPVPATAIADVFAALNPDEKAVLGWLFQHWPWFAPPKLIECARRAHHVGEHRGYPFLVVSEWDDGRSPLLGNGGAIQEWLIADHPAGNREDAPSVFIPDLGRTCVFLSFCGGELQPPTRPFLASVGRQVLVSRSSAGLFAVWPSPPSRGAIRTFLDLYRPRPSGQALWPFPTLFAAPPPNNWAAIVDELIGLVEKSPSSALPAPGSPSNEGEGSK